MITQNITRILSKCIILFCFTLICIKSFSITKKEESEILFILNLYENKQYDLAQKQISFFEFEYPNTSYQQTIYYIKANIFYYKKNFALSDSLYNLLLKSELDLDMRIEILLNRASIHFEQKKYLSAIKFLNEVLKLTKDKEYLFQAEKLYGKINYELDQIPNSIEHFNRALQYKANDQEVYLELMNIYINTDNYKQVNAIATSVYCQTPQNEASDKILINWLDYLLQREEYSLIDSLEQTIQKFNYRYTPDYIIRFSYNDYYQKRYQRALDRISSLQTTRDPLWFLAGLIRVESQKFAEADSIFQQLTKSASPRYRLLSWLERQKILFHSNPKEALRQIAEFVNKNEGLPELGEVLFQYGSLLFKYKDYQNAANILIRAKQYNLSSIMQQNVQITLGDIWFQAGMYDLAKQTYNRYLNLYPEGKYRSHAIYNLILLHIENNDYTSALGYVHLLQNNSNAKIYNEEITFLKGEIAFFQNRYQDAIDILEKINPESRFYKKSLYRRAQALFYLEDFTQASQIVEKIPSDSTNMYQVLILEGNIFFNLKNYNKALEIYQRALDNAAQDSEKKEVQSYLALTYYRKGEFDKAKELYLLLAKDPESPEAFLSMAARSAYHAKDFYQSLYLFRQFIDQYPSSPFYKSTLANIANIYYNIGDFRNAINQWVNLLLKYIDYKSFESEDINLLSGVFRGLEWGLKQAYDEVLIDSLAVLSEKFKSEYIKFELQYLLIKVYAGAELWSDLLKTADELRKEFPQRDNTEIQSLIASAYQKLGRFVEADSIYAKIYQLQPSPEILTEWAELNLAQGKDTEAIAKLEAAYQMDKKPDRLLYLFETVYESLPDSIPSMYNKWSKLVTSLPEGVLLIRLKKAIDNWEHTLADSLFAILVNSVQADLRAETQLLKGISLYNRQNYELASLELLRTIYLYADYKDIVRKAKLYLIRTCINQQMVSDAQRYYEDIKESLSESEKSEFIPYFTAKPINE